MAVIEAEGLSKTYPATGGGRALLGRGGIGRLFRRQPENPPALRPLSFSVERGEALGIIGRNGSGKSTLLKIIAGVTAPTAGTLRVDGRVASLLELGAGFHPMLTGRENVYLNAGLLGMRHAQVDACYDAIVAFAELEGHMERTVDTYSSGMYVRLAFAVAIHTDPDIFLVDEVLAVGDESFQRKCRARILELKAAGKTILFVSHDLGIVQNLCDRVLLLEDGAELSRGSARDTIAYYLRQVGAAGGIRRLKAGPSEVLFNHGRLSLFYGEHELTTPLGVKVQFFSQGAYHESTSAEWVVTGGGENALEAAGTYARLPVRLYINCALADGALAVVVSWENTQPMDLDYVAIQCFLTTAYTEWHGGDGEGVFPPIGPEHPQWSTVAPPRRNVWHYELAGAEASGVPPLCFSVTDAPEGARLQIDNGDYMNQARIVHLTEAIPTGENPLPPRRRELGTVTIDPTADAGALAQTQARRKEARHLVSGALGARLHDGYIALETEGHALTDFLHLHFQLRAGGLWIMSHDLVWDLPRNEGGRLSATGRAQRLPCALTWTLCGAEAGALDLQIVLEAQEAFSLAEYNLSLCLGANYDVWNTEEESGTFGPAAGAADEWVHGNRSYTAGTTISARGEGCPTLTLTAREMAGTVFPTAIRTGARHEGRVLQLLCSPGQAPGFSFAAGRQTLFDGTISLGPESAP